MTSKTISVEAENYQSTILSARRSPFLRICDHYPRGQLGLRPVRASRESLAEEAENGRPFIIRFVLAWSKSRIAMVHMVSLLRDGKTQRS